jgi:hypothetical protein
LTLLTVVDLASAPDFDDDHQQPFVLDRVDDAVVAGPYTPQLRADQLFAVGG